MSLGKEEGLLVVLGVAYFVRGMLSNPVGYSPASNTLQRLAAGVPSAPTAATLQTVGELSMRVEWGAPTDSGAGEGKGHPLVGYEVSLILLGESDVVVLVRSEAVGTRQTEMTGLARGSRYQVKVRAQNDALDDGGFGASAVASGVCADGVSRAGVCDLEGLVASGAPVAPSSLELLASGSGVVGVSYGVPTDAGDRTSTFLVLGYSLEWEGRALGSNTLSAGGTVELGSNVSAWETPSLPAGMTIRARVRAHNVAGIGSWTDFLSRGVMIIPDAPTFVSVGSGSVPSLYLGLHWAIPANTGAGSNAAATLTTITVEVSTKASFAPSSTLAYSLPVPTDASGNTEFSGSSDFSGNSGFARNSDPSARTARLGFEEGFLLFPGGVYFLRGVLRNEIGAGGYSQVPEP